MLAQARQIHHEGVFKLAVNRLFHRLEIHILGTRFKFGTEDFLPIWPAFDFLHALAGNHRTRPCRGRGFGFRGVLQMGIIEIIRFIIIVNLRHIGIGEDIV